jgi:hypothetical protein
MRRGTQLIVVALAVAASAVAGLAGCGRSLARPEGGVDQWACVEVLVQPLAGTPCRFEVPLPDCNGEGDRNHIGVKVAGTEIPRDPSRTNGWDYADEAMNTIDIYGPSCDALTASPTTPVSIIFKLLLP